MFTNCNKSFGKNIKYLPWNINSVTASCTDFFFLNGKGQKSQSSPWSNMFLSFLFRDHGSLFDVFQAVSHLDASPPLHPVVSLPPGLPPHELLLCCPAGCRGGPPRPQPQTGAETNSFHKSASEEKLCFAFHYWLVFFFCAVIFRNLLFSPSLTQVQLNHLPFI